MVATQGNGFQLSSQTKAAMKTAMEVKIHLRRPHAMQERFLRSKAKRKIIRAGRRGGKTTGIGILAVEAFLAGKRVLYAAPTADQAGTFWSEIKRALQEPIDRGLLKKNETMKLIEWPKGGHARIRVKTAWIPDMLRGDFADLLIIDEWQMCNEDMWELVGAPMLLDNNGDAVFIYTPPSLRTRANSKARDPRYASKMYVAAEKDTTGRWEAFHFTSHDNPYISKEALEELAGDMSALAYRQEIGAEDVDVVPGALWKITDIEETRLDQKPKRFDRIVVAIDPAVSATEGSDETGIVVAGIADCDCKHIRDILGQPVYEKHGFVLADLSGRLTANDWAETAVNAYHEWEADSIVVEVNNGGDLCETVIRGLPNGKGRSVPLRQVRASRGKDTRAEPISAKYEQKRVHHVGVHAGLEDQMTNFVPGRNGTAIDDRVDALVWSLSDLMIDNGSNRIEAAW